MDNAEKRATNENTLRNIDGRWIRDSQVGAMLQWCNVTEDVN